MNIPKSVKIGGHTFKLIYPYKCRKNDTFYGRIRYNKEKEIHISNSGNEGIAFWHEILHGIDWVYNGASLREKDIRCIAQGLWQVVNDIGITLKGK